MIKKKFRSISKSSLWDTRRYTLKELCEAYERGRQDAETEIRQSRDQMIVRLEKEMEKLDRFDELEREVKELRSQLAAGEEGQEGKKKNETEK